MKKPAFDELIYRGKLTNAARLFAKEYYESGKIGHTRKLLIEQLADKVDRLEQGWIPIEIKPVKSRHYLVLSEMNLAHGGTWEDNEGDARRNMKVAYYDCTGKFNQPCVTHWMPLPAPPNDKFEGYEQQKNIFEELEKTRKQKDEENYRSIKEVAKMMKISPMDYCDYRACRKKADEKIITSAKITQRILHNSLSG